MPVESRSKESLFLIDSIVEVRWIEPRVHGHLQFWRQIWTHLIEVRLSCTSCAFDQQDFILVICTKQKILRIVLTMSNLIFTIALKGLLRLIFAFRLVGLQSPRMHRQHSSICVCVITYAPKKEGIKIASLHRVAGDSSLIVVCEECFAGFI